LAKGRIADLFTPSVVKGFPQCVLQFNTRFLEVTTVSPKNSISISSPDFAQLTRVLNTQTHRPRYVWTSVAIGRISCTACRQRSLKTVKMPQHISVFISINTKNGEKDVPSSFKLGQRVVQNGVELSMKES